MRSIRDIREHDVLRCLTEPHRLAILQRLLLGEATVTQLGDEMGHTAAWVRHHVKGLERAGLVELAEERKTRNYTERFYRATAGAFTVTFAVAPQNDERRPLVALASHDLALELLACTLDATPDGLLYPVAVGSLDSLVALRMGLADIAGCHLLDVPTGEYNLPYVRHLFPDRPMRVVTLAKREQGLMVAPGNPLGLRDISDLVERPVRFVNRNRGSGTRLWLEGRLSEINAERAAIGGYEDEVCTHSAAARAVAAGRVDAAIGLRAAAEAADLDFVPLTEERYDLVIAEERFDDPRMQRLLDLVTSRGLQRAIGGLPGYDAAEAGCEKPLAR